MESTHGLFHHSLLPVLFRFSKASSRVCRQSGIRSAKTLEPRNQNRQMAESHQQDSLTMSRLNGQAMSRRPLKTGSVLNTKTSVESSPLNQPSSGQDLNQGYDVPTRERPQTVFQTIKRIAQPGDNLLKTNSAPSHNEKRAFIHPRFNLLGHLPDWLWANHCRCYCVRPCFHRWLYSGRRFCPPVLDLRSGYWGNPLFDGHARMDNPGDVTGRRSTVRNLRDCCPGTTANE